MIQKISVGKVRRGPLFPVGNPDIFHLVGVLEIPAAFALGGLRQVNVAAFIGPDLFQVSCGEGLGGGTEFSVAVAPDGIEIVVLGEDF